MIGYVLTKSSMIYHDYIRSRIFGGLTIKNGDLGSLAFVGYNVGGTSHWHSCPDMNFLADNTKTKATRI